jgi:hypothetical protein
MRIMRIGWMSLLASLIVTLSAHAQTNARALIERGIEALGGAQRLDGIKAGQSELKGILYVEPNSYEFTQETFFERPDRYKAVMHVKAGNQTLLITLVFDGDKGWIKRGADKTRPFEKKALAEIREERYADRVQRLTPLLGDGFQFTPLDAIKIGSKPAIGLRITSRGHRPVDVYFDQASGLPVEMVRRAVDYTNGKEYTQARVFGDYRAVDGVKTATKITIYKDGKKYMVQQAVKVKYLPKIDSSVFAEP